MCTILLMSSSGCLFAGFQEGVYELGISYWEREGGLRRWVLACGWEAAYDEASVALSVSHKVQASWV